MALNKSKIDVLFTNGINNKIDDKIVSGSTLRTLENGVFTKTGTINKRPGYEALGVGVATTGTAITDMKALVTTNDELLLAAGKKLYSYSSVNDEWVDKSDFVSATVDSTPILTNTAEQTAMDSCIVGSMALYAWNDSRGGIRYSVQDLETGSYYTQDAEISSGGDTPRCMAIGNRLFVFYGDSANLKFAYIATNDPATLVAGTTKTDLHADHLISVLAIGNKGYLWYKTATANEGSIVEVDNAGVETHVVTVTATIIDTLALGFYVDSRGLAFLHPAYKQTSSLVKCPIYSQSLVELTAAVTIDSTSSGDISKLSMHRTDAATDEMTFLYQLPGATPSDDLIKTNTLSLAGSAGTAAVFLRSMGLASNLFTRDDSLYVAILHESDLQSTVFIVNASTEVVGKFAAGNAGTHAGVGAFLPSMIDLGSGKYSFLMNIKGTIRSENATIFSRLGINRSTLDFESGNTFDYTTMSQDLFLTGGILSLYDGSSVVEAGFNLFPEGVAAADSVSGGSMVDGVYQYSVVYSWIDAKGNTHRSAPSIPLSVTVDEGGSSQSVAVTIPTLRLTQKTSPRTEVTLEVFRTEDAGSIFYRVSSITAPTDNDPTADTVVFTDTLADASITANEILYTTGGVLDNIAPPSCDIVVNHTNRVFLAGLQDKNEIRFSKIVRAGEGVSFNEALSIPVDPRGGDIVTIASMDANLVVFKRDNIYVVSGNGPSDTGAGSTFSEPSLIAADVGCIDSQSVVLGPQGLYFKSAKGIYLLSRSLQTTYIGAPVEDFNGLAIVSSQLLDDVNEVRFSTASGTTLVFNYYFNQWSVFTKQFSLDSVIWRTKFLYVSTSDEIRQESTTSFTDAGASVGLKIATGWVKVGGLQGFQRAYRATILGEFKTRHHLRLKVFTDYSDTVTQVVEFTPQDVLSVDSGFYGDGVYGVVSPYGSQDNGVYQFQAHMRRQKCQSVRFEIEDVIDNSLDSGNSESATFTGISLEIGVKRGQNKLAEGKKS